MKKSLAALLAIALVLTSLFALNLIASAEGETATVGRIAIADGYAENQSNASNSGVSRTTVSNHALASGEPLYTAGYTTVYKYEYNMLQADGTYYEDGFNKYLSQKKAFSYTTGTGFTAANVGAAAKYARFFVRVPVNTKITLNLANGWSTVYTKTIDVKAVNGGAGYSEIVISLTDAEISDKTIKNTFVYVANGILARECSTIYVSAIELWDSQPTAVLNSAEQVEPEWIATTNGYLEKYNNVVETYQNAAKTNEYWSTVEKAEICKFSFESKEQMEAYYASGNDMEFRFKINNKTNEAYVKPSFTTNSDIPISNITSDMAVSLWIKAPKNMQITVAFYADYQRFGTGAITVGDSWQQIIVPVSSFKALSGNYILDAINVTPVAVKDGDVVDYVTSWNYGEELFISWPQLVSGVDSTLATAVASDTVEFESKYMGYTQNVQNQSYSAFSNAIAYIKDMKNVDACVTEAGHTYFRTITINSTFYDEEFNRNKTALRQYSFKDNSSKDIDTTALINNGVIKFYVLSPRDVTLTFYMLNGWSDQSTVDVEVKANTYQEVVVKLADLSRTAAVTSVMLGVSSADFASRTLQTGDVIYWTPAQMYKDCSAGALTDANTITAEMTADASDAENGFNGLRKLTVKDIGFYALSDADRAITHTFGSTVNQADVDYLGFWVKAPKAMTLKLIFTDSYGVAVTTDVAVNGTLKQGGYQFVTLSREQLKLNYLADIVSLTLTPATTAEEFLSENEALYYSAFTLYSGKPVSFYESYKTGDANGNGTVDIRDLVRARAATDITYAADVIENGKIDSADMVAFRNILLGIE